MKSTEADSELARQFELCMAALEVRVRMSIENDAASLQLAVDRLTRARAAISMHREGGVRGRIDDLFDRLRLSDSEHQVVWLLATLALSNDARALMQRATAGHALDPTFGQLRDIVYGAAPSLAAHSELSGQGRLVRLHVIERTDSGARDTHESQWTWALSARVLRSLLGDSSPRLDLGELVEVDAIAPGEVVVAATTMHAVDKALTASTAVVSVVGRSATGRRALLKQRLAASGASTLDIRCCKLSKDHNVLVTQLRRLVLECRLLECVPLLVDIDALEAEQVAHVGSELVTQIDGVILCTSRGQLPNFGWRRPLVVVQMDELSFEQRVHLWRTTLGQGTQQDAEHLANQYPLAPGLIHRAAAAAKTRAAGEKLTPEDIYAGIRTVLDDRLGDFARRVTVTQTWDDLVLPQEQVDAIVELMARVRQRRKVYEQWGFGPKVGKGLGVSALFSGPPGTGKTMVAALIARDLGLELYQVDLGKIMSKWIGETEKNLGALFDAAEAGHAILLFDEADALFGKRTEVKSSNDRHANLETNYLLQRLESFTGICLLTSNHESNIDPAFQRRLSLHLRFELPDEVERAHLWRAMIPAAAPVAPDVDLGSLAKRFAMSGGYIRNAALRAAFLAADEGSAISPGHLERAARLEYEGMGKIAL